MLYLAVLAGCEQLQTPDTKVTGICSCAYICLVLYFQVSRDVHITFSCIFSAKYDKSTRLCDNSNL